MGKADQQGGTTTNYYMLVGGSGSVSLNINNTGDGNRSGLGDVSNLNGSVSAVTDGFAGPDGDFSILDSASATFKYTFTPALQGGTASAVVTANFLNGSSDGANTAHSKEFAFSAVGVARSSTTRSKIPSRWSRSLAARPLSPSPSRTPATATFRASAT